MRKKLLKVNPYVFFPSAILIIAFVCTGVIFTESGRIDDPLTVFMMRLQAFITEDLGWFYLISTTTILVFIVWIMFSRHGSIRLGPDDEEPEFGLLSWFAMLFSAGMGIGLLFYGVAEPISIFTNPPSPGIAPQSTEAAAQALRYTFFHWGLHGWAVYILVGLSLAYFSYRHKLPLSLRSALYPILGKKIYGFWGHVVEIFAVIGTLFGVATSLGFGVMQVNSGLAHLNIFDYNTSNQIFLIIGITLIATISVVSGVNKGVRLLSEVNLFLALILLAFVFFAGPTTYLLKAFSENIGNYLQTLTETSFQTNIFYNNQFSSTVFYFGWWIAWSPFVGMFIARISRGRTIREFIFCVLLVPVTLTFIWMTVFGNTAIHMELMGSGGMVEAVQHNISTALFVMLQEMPLPTISCTLAILVIIFFFITSSDSASLVIDIITSGGQKNPPVWQKIFWAFAEGFVAIILLLTGGLAALQTGVIATALPFTIVLLFVGYCLWKALKTDTGIDVARESGEEENIMLSRNFISVAGIQPIDTPISEGININSKNVLADAPMLDQISEIVSDDLGSKNWKSRLNRLKKKNYAKYFADQHESIPDEDIEIANNNLKDFILKIVKPAFVDIEKELEKYGRTIQINLSEHQASIIVKKGNVEELFYGIGGKVFHRLGYNFPNFNVTDTTVKCYAQVLLRSGVKKVYDLKKFTRKNIIHDFLNEYEKWAILD